MLTRHDGSNQIVGYLIQFRTIIAFLPTRNNRSRVHNIHTTYPWVTLPVMGKGVQSQEMLSKRRREPSGRSVSLTTGDC